MAESLLNEQYWVKPCLLPRHELRCGPWPVHCALSFLGRSVLIRSILHPRHEPHCRHGHGAYAYTALGVVLGRLPGCQPDTRHVGRPVSAATRTAALRDGFPDSSQTAGWHGASRPGSRIGGNPAEHIEADETYVGGRTRGKGRGVHDMVLVAGAVEVRQRKQGGSLNQRRTGRYAGRVRLAVVPDRSAKSLGGFIERVVMPGTTIIDDWSGYPTLGKRGYLHTAVAERGDMQVAQTFLPIIHLVFPNLKTWLRGIHHGVSPQHLQAYLRIHVPLQSPLLPIQCFELPAWYCGQRHRADLCLTLCKKNHDPLHLVSLGAKRISTEVSFNRRYRGKGDEERAPFAAPFDPRGPAAPQSAQACSSMKRSAVPGSGAVPADRFAAVMEAGEGDAARTNPARQVAMAGSVHNQNHHHFQSASAMRVDHVPR